jgi:cell division protein FtsI/penicillin-binding protein 2
MAEGPRRRLRILSTVLAILAGLVILRLLQLQIIEHKQHETEALELRVRTVPLPLPPRGAIFDRGGHLLAGNSVVYSIDAYPPYVVDPDETAVALEEELHIPRTQIWEMLTSDQLWVPILSPVSKAVGERIEQLRLQGVTVQPLWKREYPEHERASHVLGFCNSEAVGFYGVEGYYDRMLQPSRMTWSGPVDLQSRQMPWSVVPVVFPSQGTDLVLTVDRTVQAIVEDELAASIEEYAATGGTIIVMNPATFEIRAMASLPNYDPGDYVDYFSRDRSPFEDPAVSKQYEPGSVFKVVTMAAALDSGLVTPGSPYYDQGFIEVGGQVIRNATRKAYGSLTVSDIVIKSLNVGSAWLSVQMGTDVFYRYVQAFGVGQPTQVDLAGEVAGQLWLPEDIEHWHDSNLGTNSFGQGVAVTPLQMICSVAAVANGGEMLRPHVVDRRTAPDGTVSVFHQSVRRRVISESTAKTLTDMLVRVIEEGVPKAKMDGYRVAGKTGTAQIPVPGGYDPSGTIATFVGFGPVPEPELVVLIKLDRPGKSPWASQTSAEVFPRLAKRLFVVLGVPPTEQVLAEAAG